MDKKFLLRLSSLVAEYLFMVFNINLFIYSLWVDKHWSIPVFVAILLNFLIVSCIIDTIKFVKEFKNRKKGDVLNEEKK